MRAIGLAAIFSVLFVVSSPAVAAQSIHLTRTGFQLKDGEVWGHWGATFACTFLPTALTWEGNSKGPDTARLSAAFDDELTNAGLAPARSTSLFDEAPKGGLELGLVITHMDAVICSESDEGIRRFRGKMTMSAEWQVYDPVRAEVVARLSTSAFGETKTLSRDGVAQVLLAAFRANAAKLFADPSFRRVLSTGADASTASAALPVHFIPASGKRPIAASSNSVATIITGEGWGSGFLISSDGYMLTNHHVVGSATQVRVRWADKAEGVAQVVRSDRRRDVALLRVEPNGGHAALPIRGVTAQPGEAVFAIGTPLDRNFENTVTKGVVSATRVIEGQSFVQSDVAVDHGNSGGPLLDENGQVIAITDWGYVPDGVSHNLNFFIPIDDALKALALSPVAATPAKAAAPPAAGPLRRKG